MCGIVGYVGSQDSTPILLDGLKRLEYRGYDSAGIAVHTGRGLEVRRTVGKLSNLESAVSRSPARGSLGIGHTRWATHGRPSEPNAHPHAIDGVALVHNGIFENHSALRHELVAKGCKMESETDTELAAHLVSLEMRAGRNLPDAVRSSLKRIRGAYAIAVISEKDPNRIVIAKNVSPLVIGLGKGEMFCGSDIPALLPHTKDMVFLEDGDMAILTRDGVDITDPAGKAVQRATRAIHWSPVMAEKDGYKHFMLKEIFEQPRAIEDTLRGRLDRESADVYSAEIGLDKIDVGNVRRVVFLACGSSHYATMAGRHWMEALAGIPSCTELASEFRNRPSVIGPEDLVVAVSQSGETLDTLLAARRALDRGAAVLAVANVVGSAIPRTAHGTFYTHAGPEIGVASTKCFSAQLAALLMLAVCVGRKRGTLTEDAARDIVESLAQVPSKMNEVLVRSRDAMADLARTHGGARDALFLGRGLSHPIALEGSLKLKEISYVHAEGYAAGEMKHGPIALLDHSVPVFVIAPEDESREKTLANLEEAKARDAKVILLTTEGMPGAGTNPEETILVPAVHPALTPFLTVVPLQLYAYYVADQKGTDVDQPRNLAKTVTVE